MTDPPAQGPRPASATVADRALAERLVTGARERQALIDAGEGEPQLYLATTPHTNAYTAPAAASTRSIGRACARARASYCKRCGSSPRPYPAVASTIVAGRDFTTTLHDGRRVVGRKRECRWDVNVYSPDRRARLLGFGSALTRPTALASAGLSGEDASENLGRIGI